MVTLKQLTSSRLQTPTQEEVMLSRIITQAMRRAKHDNRSMLIMHLENFLSCWRIRY
jgi:hypothetical protein